MRRSQSSINGSTINRAIFPRLPRPTALRMGVLCIALALLSGCPASPPAKPTSKPEPGPVQKFPEVWAGYAQPGELPLDGSSLTIELEVPPIPPKLLAPAPPIGKDRVKR